MIEVVGVSLENERDVYYFLPNGMNLKKNITVIVETDKGLEFGKVQLENFKIKEEKIKAPLNRIVRIASKDDYNNFKKNEKDEKIAFEEAEFEYFKSEFKNNKIKNSKELNNFT